jgi:hypothetical protein
LYRLGEDYTNERILERINQNSYTVKFSDFHQSKDERKVHYIKGNFKKTKKIGGLLGLYFHYCYRLGILPRSQKQNYTRVHYLLKDDLLKMDAIIKETRLLCQKKFESVEQLFLYKETLKTEKSHLLERRKALYSKSRSCKSEKEKEEIRSELSSISGRVKVIGQEVRCCDGIIKRSSGLKEKLQIIQREENEKRREVRENEHRRRGSRANR